ncbi:diiron oxygenase [Roseibium sp. M-1]
MKNWDQKATVRTQAYRPVNSANVSFPEEYVPVLKHPSVLRLSKDKWEVLCKSALFRFLNFTHKLEMLVVNTVTSNIAMHRYDFDINDTTRIGAHKLYVDEAYHALFSFDMLVQMRAADKTDLLVEFKPSFLKRMDDLRKGTNRKTRAFLELFFVIVSEMLITSTLRDVHKNADLDEEVRMMIRDHATDEARHHAFYRQFLFAVWPQISIADQAYLLKSIPQLILAYCEPDFLAMGRELECLGYSSEEASSILVETYPVEATKKFSFTSAAYLIDEMRSIAASEHRHLFEDQICSSLAA